MQGIDSDYLTLALVLVSVGILVAQVIAAIVIIITIVMRLQFSLLWLRKSRWCSRAGRQLRVFGTGSLFQIFKGSYLLTSVPVLK